MTGNDHFEAAELLLDESGESMDEGVADWKVAKAQVHATLAVAWHLKEYLPGRMA